MRLLYLISFPLFSLSLVQACHPLLEGKKRILFLGDSITQAGDYVVNFDTWLVKAFPEKRFTVLNAGLSSETVSGLSEENHAGGRFPRPCLFERLERVLALTQPDLIIACYGMNCGIYKELSEERFARFRHGIMRLRAAAKQYDAEIIHVTPPIFDYREMKGFNYDDVLSKYSAWLVQQREQGWHVADLHSEMSLKIKNKRKTQPNYIVQKDRIHPNKEGHWMMAQSLITYFGDTDSAKLSSADELLPAAVFGAIDERMKTYQKAIHAETKPLRPGVPKAGNMKGAELHALKLAPSIYSKTD